MLRQGRLVGFREPGSLVDFETESVSQRMAECIAEPSRFDQRPRERICLTTGHTRTNVRYRSVLRLPHQFVDDALALIRHPPHDHRPGDVRTVPLALRPEIEQQKLSGHDQAIAGAGVREGGPRARGDDRLKRMPLTATPAEL